jgi:hypothetical protein
MSYDKIVKAVGLAACAVGICIGYYLGRVQQPKGAFVLVVKLKLKAGTRDKFVEAWGQLAKHCYLNEPRTLTVSIPLL